MTVKTRLRRLEGTWRKVTPSYDLDGLEETGVRYILALQERGGELSDGERAAIAAIDEKVRVRWQLKGG